MPVRAIAFPDWAIMIPDFGVLDFALLNSVSQMFSTGLMERRTAAPFYPRNAKRASFSGVRSFDFQLFVFTDGTALNRFLFKLRADFTAT